MALVRLAHGSPGPSARENLDLVRAWAEAAAYDGAAVLVTPELFCAPDPTASGGALRARFAEIARTSGIALVASSPEHDAGARFVALSWWDRFGNLGGHVRKHRPGPAQLASGFSAWDGPPAAAALQGEGLEGGVICCADDVEIPEFAAFLKHSGAARALVSGSETTALLEFRNAHIPDSAYWNPMRSGVPFSQRGPLPQPLLRPLPRPYAGWFDARPPEPRDGS
ncbi:nitrilase-related carbon-nitrogen hydrolase [Zafaria sp. J156]|uniref:nitrilase-related carbon-nitrogen hydrolase n=1 Tax=Zafaria sp. J156 TaxID=3116490 RepID=UPI002E760D8E|nr:nitrilase-related carbon-nitrogen hydrolase [Zafaria sp. J156]MEE1621438.1 nitrilase-related carbon-nitrogen hydrolase [Zafaria sp. J156]